MNPPHLWGQRDALTKCVAQTGGSRRVSILRAASSLAENSKRFFLDRN